MTCHKKTHIVSMIITLTMSLIFLASCNTNFLKSEPTPTPTKVPLELQDRSWLTGEPCAPPCWYGLEIDVSTEEEVLTVLETLPFIDFYTINLNLTGSGDALTGEIYSAITYTLSVVGQKKIELKIGKGVLKSIQFGLNYEITLGEIVDQIGPPDALYTFLEGEPSYCEVGFIWVDKQLSVSYYIYDSDSVEKCEEIRVGNLFDRNLAISYVRYAYINWFLALQEKEFTVPWAGFSE